MVSNGALNNNNNNNYFSWWRVAELAVSLVEIPHNSRNFKLLTAAT
jgi:hypothetical protein